MQIHILLKSSKKFCTYRHVMVYVLDLAETHFKNINLIENNDQIPV